MYSDRIRKKANLA